MGTNNVSTKTLFWSVFVDTIMIMDTWDETKRTKTLLERGLDFADAEAVFRGRHFTRANARKDYGEPRFITAGWIDGRFVVLVWTPRDGERRIISMRYGHADEENQCRSCLG